MRTDILERIRGFDLRRVAALILVPEPLPVIVRVDASVVGLAVDCDPICLIDPSGVAVSRADRECRGQLDPPALLTGNHTDLIGNFGEVLVLAENQRHVVQIAVSQSHHVQRDPDVDPFLLADPDRFRLAVWERDRLIAVTKVPPENADATLAQGREFGSPEVVPDRVVLGVRNPRVEMRPLQLPIPGLADSTGKGQRSKLG